MPSQRLTRRDFLKLAPPVMLWPLLSRLAPTTAAPQAPDRPNVLVVVFDTLAAQNMSLFGYRRPTTPHLERFAKRATVFHQHYAGGNFTTPGTASLLTGSYGWSHRAFSVYGTVADHYVSNNIFAAFAAGGYHRMAYTHNRLADYLLYQFRQEIDQYLTPETFFLAGYPPYDRLFPNDRAIAYRSAYLLSRGGSLGSTPGSLFGAAVSRFALEQYDEGVLMQRLGDLYPEGLPIEATSHELFLIEHAIDGIQRLVAEAPRPFLGYFHLLPPHSPYNPRREFLHAFADGWAPDPKPSHFFTADKPDELLGERRQAYDEFIANADAEFGRLYDFLEISGRLDDTYVVFTSDHGEIFERGMLGHATPVLYDPLVRVPLVISAPGQRQRVDVHTPTSCTDLLPTLLSVTGQAAAGWSEGQVLPTFGPASTTDRSLFSIEAKENSSFAALQHASIALIKGDYKLVDYLGYEGYADVSELYNLANDPEEVEDLVAVQAGVAAELRDELLQKLKAVNQPFKRPA